jgi:hypothetical protein
MLFVESTVTSMMAQRIKFNVNQIKKIYTSTITFLQKENKMKNNSNKQECTIFQKSRRHLKISGPHKGYMKQVSY